MNDPNAETPEWAVLLEGPPMRLGEAASVLRQRGIEPRMEAPPGVDPTA